MTASAVSNTNINRYTYMIHVRTRVRACCIGMYMCVHVRVLVCVFEYPSMTASAMGITNPIFSLKCLKKKIPNSNTDVNTNNNRCTLPFSI